VVEEPALFAVSSPDISFHGMALVVISMGAVGSKLSGIIDMRNKITIRELSSQNKEKRLPT
jgi:hypothetical protein